MTTVDLVNLTKQFRDVTAVSDVTLRVEAGEFLAIVGPTGCGKTTLLRLIAGLEDPTSGEVRFDGESMRGVSTPERRVRMVFQDYALYPHLRVFRERGYSNLGFPLNLRKMKGETLRTNVESLAKRMGIAKRLFPRRPGELSSGEQQKVALGRALSLPPRVLLLDEPFSNLDSASRVRAQDELRSEHNANRVTTLHVTHSLAEAFHLADRIAVMDEGRIIQVGTPDAVQAHPANELVRTLIESSRRF
jgi:ABC-type sugar transport system ATPase subunit